MGWRDVVYGAYERRVLKDLPKEALPRHVGIILDGNRRWARGGVGKSTAGGHQAGADKIVEFLGLVRGVADVEVVTLWLLSTDNLQRGAGGGAPAAARDHRGHGPGGTSPSGPPLGLASIRSVRWTC